MDLTVRPAGRQDAERIADLHVSTWRETYAHLLPEDFFGTAHARMRLDMWSQILDHPRDDQTVRVAEIDGLAVGFAMVGPSTGTEAQPAPRERQLFTLYVRTDAHGTGIGQTLLDAVLGAGPAMLWAARQSPRALAFYRRNGFEPDGTEKVDPGTPAITGVRMVR